MVHNISNIVIAGAGIMGSSIAQLFAGHGYRVVLYDINDEVLEKSRKLILINQEALAQSGGLSGKTGKVSGIILHFPVKRRALKERIL